MPLDRKFLNGIEFLTTIFSPRARQAPPCAPTLPGTSSPFLLFFFRSFPDVDVRRLGDASGSEPITSFPPLGQPVYESRRVRVSAASKIA